MAKFGFPNTYTFSKHMAEQALGRRRKNIRIAILRPSSILACCKQPFVGWVDSVGTAGSIIMPMGLGLIDTFQLKPKPAW
ncbi:MAG: SDR family oxidoreductase [bacterium]